MGSQRYFIHIGALCQCIHNIWNVSPGTHFILLPHMTGTCLHILVKRFSKVCTGTPAHKRALGPVLISDERSHHKIPGNLEAARLVVQIILSLEDVTAVVAPAEINPDIARFMGPTWGPSGADRTQVGPMLAPKTLLSGKSDRTLLNNNLTDSRLRETSYSVIFIIGEAAPHHSLEGWFWSGRFSGAECHCFRFLH